MPSATSNTDKQSSKFNENVKQIQQSIAQIESFLTQGKELSLENVNKLKAILLSPDYQSFFANPANQEASDEMQYSVNRARMILAAALLQTDTNFADAITVLNQINFEESFNYLEKTTLTAYLCPVLSKRKDVLLQSGTLDSQQKNYIRYYMARHEIGAQFEAERQKALQKRSVKELTKDELQSIKAKVLSGFLSVLKEIDWQNIVLQSDHDDLLFTAEELVLIINECGAYNSLLGKRLYKEEIIKANESLVQRLLANNDCAAKIWQHLQLDDYTETKSWWYEKVFCLHGNGEYKSKANAILAWVHLNNFQNKYFGNFNVKPGSNEENYFALASGLIKPALKYFNDAQEIECIQFNYYQLNSLWRAHKISITNLHGFATALVHAYANSAPGRYLQDNKNHVAVAHLDTADSVREKIIVLSKEVLEKYQASLLPADKALLDLLMAQHYINKPQDVSTHCVEAMKFVISRQFIEDNSPKANALLQKQYIEKFKQEFAFDSSEDQALCSSRIAIFSVLLREIDRLEKAEIDRKILLDYVIDIFQAASLSEAGLNKLLGKFIAVEATSASSILVRVLLRQLESENLLTEQQLVSYRLHILQDSVLIESITKRDPALFFAKVVQPIDVEKLKITHEAWSYLIDFDTEIDKALINKIRILQARCFAAKDGGGTPAAQCLSQIEESDLKQLLTLVDWDRASLVRLAKECAIEEQSTETQKKVSTGEVIARTWRFIKAYASKQEPSEVTLLINGILSAVYGTPVQVANNKIDRTEQFTIYHLIEKFGSYLAKLDNKAHLLQAFIKPDVANGRYENGQTFVKRFLNCIQLTEDIKREDITKRSVEWCQLLLTTPGFYESRSSENRYADISSLLLELTQAGENVKDFLEKLLVDTKIRPFIIDYILVTPTQLAALDKSIIEKFFADDYKDKSDRRFQLIKGIVTHNKNYQNSNKEFTDLLVNARLSAGQLVKLIDVLHKEYLIAKPIDISAIDYSSVIKDTIKSSPVLRGVIAELPLDISLGEASKELIFDLLENKDWILLIPADEDCSKNDRLGWLLKQNADKIIPLLDSYKNQVQKYQNDYKENLLAIEKHLRETKPDQILERVNNWLNQLINYGRSPERDTIKQCVQAALAEDSTNNSVDKDDATLYEFVRQFVGVLKARLTENNEEIKAENDEKIKLKRINKILQSPDLFEKLTAIIHKLVDKYSTYQKSDKSEETAEKAYGYFRYVIINAREQLNDLINLAYYHNGLAGKKKVNVDDDLEGFLSQLKQCDELEADSQFASSSCNELIYVALTEKSLFIPKENNADEETNIENIRSSIQTLVNLVSPEMLAKALNELYERGEINKASAIFRAFVWAQKNKNYDEVEFVSKAVENLISQLKPDSKKVLIAYFYSSGHSLSDLSALFDEVTMREIVNELTDGSIFSTELSVLDCLVKDKKVLTKMLVAKDKDISQTVNLLIKANIFLEQRQLDRYIMLVEVIIQNPNIICHLSQKQFNTLFNQPLRTANLMIASKEITEEYRQQYASILKKTVLENLRQLINNVSTDESEESAKNTVISLVAKCLDDKLVELTKPEAVMTQFVKGTLFGPNKQAELLNETDLLALFTPDFIRLVIRQGIVLTYPALKGKALEYIKSLNELTTEDYAGMMTAFTPDELISIISNRESVESTSDSEEMQVLEASKDKKSAIAKQLLLKMLSTVGSAKNLLSEVGFKKLNAACKGLQIDSNDIINAVNQLTTTEEEESKKENFEKEKLSLLTQAKLFVMTSDSVKVSDSLTLQARLDYIKSAKDDPENFAGYVPKIRAEFLLAIATTFTENHSQHATFKALREKIADAIRSALQNETYHEAFYRQIADYNFDQANSLLKELFSAKIITHEDKILTHIKNQVISSNKKEFGLALLCFDKLKKFFPDLAPKFIVDNDLLTIMVMVNVWQSISYETLSATTRIQLLNDYLKSQEKIDAKICEFLTAQVAKDIVQHIKSHEQQLAAAEFHQLIVACSAVDKTITDKGIDPNFYSTLLSGLINQIPQRLVKWCENESSEKGTAVDSILTDYIDFVAAQQKIDISPLFEAVPEDLEAVTVKTLNAITRNVVKQPKCLNQLLETGQSIVQQEKASVFVAHAQKLVTANNEEIGIQSVDIQSWKTGISCAWALISTDLDSAKKISKNLEPVISKGGALYNAPAAKELITGFQAACRKEKRCQNSGWWRFLYAILPIDSGKKAYAKLSQDTTVSGAKLYKDARLAPAKAGGSIKISYANQTGKDNAGNVLEIYDKLWLGAKANPVVMSHRDEVNDKQEINSDKQLKVK